MKKRTLVTLVSAIACMAALTACGGGKTESAAPKTDETTKAGESAKTDETTKVAESMKSGDGTKLTVAIWDNNQKAGIDEIIKDFTAETGIIKFHIFHKQIKVYWCFYDNMIK